VVSVSYDEVLSEAKRVFLAMRGVVAVSRRGNVIVVYVEDEEAARLIPREFMGLPVEVRVIGRVGLL
jgi:hypothetical protein